MRVTLLKLIGVVALVLVGLCTVTLAQPESAEATQVRGVLLDAEGLPASGYQLGLKSATGDLFLAPPTGLDGSFALDSVPAGTYRVVAFSPDGAEFPVVGGDIELMTGRVQRVELRLQSLSNAPGRAPTETTPSGPPRSGSWFSRTWHSGGGGRLGLIALITGGTYGLVELLDDDEKTVSPSDP